MRPRTESSIFIDLSHALRRTGRLIENPAFDDLRTGAIVSAHMGPAAAPLRRVVDQVIRLLDLTLPMLSEEPEPPPPPRTSGRGGKRHPQQAGKQAPDTEARGATAR